MTQTTKELERLNDAIEGIMAATGVPGVAIGVVEGTGLTFARGFGVRDVDTGEPMTTRTPYPIASTTKAMNATLIAMLVDDGLLAWDRAVRHYLPEFDLADPAAGRLLTLRDLVSMRTGLPRHDWVWVAGALPSRSDLAGRFRHLPTIAAPRERFMYNNLTVALAGHIAETAAGTSWEQLVTERLLRPLGMDETLTERPAGATSSYYEAEEEGTLVRSVRLPGEVTAPSGGIIHSTIEDMARWAAFNLSGGEVDGRRLLSAAAFDELRVPRSLLGDAVAGGYSNTAAYGLGWFVDDLNGAARISHGGYLDDVDSSVMTLPGHGLGVVCFTNAGPFGLAKPIAEAALALVLGSAPASLDDHLAAYREQRRVRREQVAAATRVPDAPPSHPLAEYAGAYDHPGYGETLVTLDGDRLVLRRTALEVPLAHWHFDSWVAEDSERFGWRENAFDRTNRLTFDTDGDGSIAGLTIRFELLAEPIRFARVR